MKSIVSKFGFGRPQSKGGEQPPPPPPPQQSAATTPLLSTMITSSSAVETTLNSTRSSGYKSQSNPNNRAQQQQQRPTNPQTNNKHGILHKPRTSPPKQPNPTIPHEPPTSRVRFAPQTPNSGNLSSLSSTTSSPSQVHLMASCGASVASLSVVSKDSIFDRVLKEENERLNAMGMGGRDSPEKGEGKKDKMRGGRRVEI
ncbi:hypothetical protein QTG54_014879 [Skeletonema marinoi]|uniref:Uncharacterized protein n=1 Tax=Skeletonema marinoi TaxID=267567 RepID=A0AAD8XVB4_9STRA|nr:hypothetical protein QTG54_014879 [Skeletonema marinoi]